MTFLPFSYTFAEIWFARYMKKTSIKILRYIPIVVALLMCVHCGLLVFGVDERFTQWFMVAYGFILVMAFSHALNFCSLHRHLIYYSFVVFVCIIYQRHFSGFGEYLFLARFVMFLVGIIIILVTVCRARKNCWNKSKL